MLIDHMIPCKMLTGIASKHTPRNIFGCHKKYPNISLLLIYPITSPALKQPTIHFQQSDQGLMNTWRTLCFVFPIYKFPKVFIVGFSVGGGSLCLVFPPLQSHKAWSVGMSLPSVLAHYSLWGGEDARCFSLVHFCSRGMSSILKLDQDEDLIQTFIPNLTWLSLSWPFQSWHFPYLDEFCWWKGVRNGVVFMSSLVIPLKWIP